MTILELLKQDIQKLNNIRIPVGDLDTIRAISEVANDLIVCVQTIEENDRKQAETKTEAVSADDVDMENGSEA